jgi:Pyruvate dehydrogenase complex, dehydrogenase (E1) component
MIESVTSEDGAERGHNLTDQTRCEAGKGEQQPREGTWSDRQFNRNTAGDEPEHAGGMGSERWRSLVRLACNAQCMISGASLKKDEVTGRPRGARSSP